MKEEDVQNRYGTGVGEIGMHVLLNLCLRHVQEPRKVVANVSSRCREKLGYSISVTLFGPLGCWSVGISAMRFTRVCAIDVCDM